MAVNPFVRFLDRCAPGSKLAFGVALIATFGILDYLSDPEIAFSLFYIAPVALVSWYVHRPFGFLVAGLAAGVWMTAEYGSGVRYAHAYALYWNGVVRLGTFLIVAYLTSTLRERLQREQELAARDPLTGLYNARVFYVRVEEELWRARRYDLPFTLAYFCLDRLKAYRDRHGVQAADELLRAIANDMRRHARPDDVLACVSAEEFAVLFSESGPPIVDEMINRVHHGMSEVVKRHRAEVTVRVGAATYSGNRDSFSALMKRADDAVRQARAVSRKKN